MLFIDTINYQVLLLKTNDGEWVYPSDDIQEISKDIGIIVDDIKLIKIRGKYVYICSQGYKLQLSNKYCDYKWESTEAEICSIVKEIFK